MGGAGPLWLDLGALVLLGGLGFAAFLDARTREVPDWLWQGLGIVGALGGVIVLSTDGGWSTLIWVLVAGLALEHVIPWDAHGGEWMERWADALELLGYLGVVVAVGVGVVRLGLGPGGTPPTAVALLVTVVVARVLFEAGVLYGGADAKALIIAGLLVPLFPVPWLSIPANGQLAASIFPFAVNLLMDAALLSAFIPVAVALRNARRGEFSVGTGFTTYTIPVADLPHQFVWVRDPVYPTDREEEESIETSEDDRQWRVRVAGELEARGVPRIRVGPQLPFVVLLAAGALGALLWGNWIIDVLAWL
ncbi:MAG: hypothetical protein L3K10_06850 [Thermoplasmata archaeon]|nr:hypothetical protein [Thermoplasmata archaeon]